MRRKLMRRINFSNYDWGVYIRIIYKYLYISIYLYIYIYIYKYL